MRLVSMVAAVLLAASACAGSQATGRPATPSVPATPQATPATEATPGPTRVVLMTHSSFAVTESVIDAFEASHGVTVEILRGEDAGSMVNQAILTKDAPLADAMYGIDNTFLSRALDADIFDPYVSPAAAGVPADLKLGTGDKVTPIDYGDVCVNYDRDEFSRDVAPPSSIADLAGPPYNDKLVVENPATSSPGLAFLFATVATFGETGDYTWRDYWTDLVANGVEVVDDWDTAYYGSFSGGSGEGDNPLVVSYATSPVAEVVFADPPVDTAPTGVITDGCFRQVEYAGILRGAQAPDLARQLIDYMLSTEFQADIPLNMYVFPARPDVPLPDAFIEHAPHVETPIVVDPADLARGRDRLVQEWTDLVLH
jgi:thiamine transport system substrate-binding protein